MVWARNLGVRDGLVRRLEDVSKKLRLFAVCCIGVFGLLAVQSCKKEGKAPAPITITIIDQNWPDAEYQRQRNDEFRRFTEETGIGVEVLPSPEGAVEQLEVWRKLLDSHANTPDVFAMDVIWPAILGDQLLDLRPYIPAQEIAEQFPGLISNFTVKGRLVAFPYNLSEGLLYYRTDLLRKYGYRSPPRTWEELEKQAGRIQAGERARGQKNFWGFVWEGASSEALTSNALEWQASEGGGTIIDDGAITVNNPRAIWAWKRAASWPGSISPASVIAYTEWDAFNRWKAGQAVFMRNWSSAYVVASAKDSPVKGKFAISALPGGSAGVRGTLGGSGYAVSRYSLHPREAAMLVRFLCGRNEQLRRSQEPAEPPTIPELYSNPSVLAANPYFPGVLEVYQKGIAIRPSTVTGKGYPDVSRAYFEAVHAVLTHKATSEAAAAELERKLTQITGLNAEPIAAKDR